MLWKLVRLMRELLSSIEKLLWLLIAARVIFRLTKLSLSEISGSSKHKKNVNPVLALTFLTQIFVSFCFATNGGFVSGNSVGLTVAITSFCRIISKCAQLAEDETRSTFESL